MTPEEILNLTKCGDLFPRDISGIKDKYRELAKEYHPDGNENDTSDTFLKITQLYHKAMELMKEGTWEKTNYIMITKDNSKKVEITYQDNFDFELGKCYITSTKIVYILSSDKKKYFDNAVNAIHNIKFSDDKMKNIIGQYLPIIYQTFQTNQGEYVLVLNKTDDVYCLKTVFESFGNKIEDRHVAWIMSRLSNLACYLQYAKITHNGINLNNCFISPHYHSILLLGGWWYVTDEGKPMIGTSKDIYSVMPVTSKGSKLSSYITDLESIKLLGRQLLGEPNCRKLLLNTEIPEPFLKFVTSGSGNDARTEFHKWDKVLDSSYGERKFIKMIVPNLNKKEK